MTTLPRCYRCGRRPCECGAALYHGCCLDIAPTLPAGSVHCVVTSPPYFGLRSYLDVDDPLKDKEIGSEATPEEFIETMVRVFREVRRVIRDDGVLFLNLGDSYNAGTSAKRRPSGNHSGDGYSKHGYWTNPAIDQRVNVDGMATGNLLNIPHRVAEALRADGWIHRQTIIWAKKSPMPESVKGVRWEQCKVKVEATPRGQAGNRAHANGDRPQANHDGHDFAPAKYTLCPGCPKCDANDGWVLRRGKGRCTTAHEYLFVLTKSDRYFWDSVGCAEPVLESSKKRAAAGFNPTKGDDANHYGDGFQRGPGYVLQSRNPRSVWTLSTEPTNIPHFATFPSELVRRCLSAGVSAKGCCPHCGAPWAPMIESERVPTRPGTASKIRVPHGWATGDVPHTAQAWQTELGREEIGNRDSERHIAVTKCLGYKPTCDCPEHKLIGSLVFDPFAGIGTVGQTAIKLGNRFIGIDLNEKYLKVAATRIFEPPRWWLRQQTGKPTVKPMAGQKEFWA